MKTTTGLIAASVIAAASAGCTPPPAHVNAVVNEKVYSVSPATTKVKVGIVTGEMSEMKVTERVEEGSGRITAPAKLTGKLVLKNISADQTVRLLGGKIVYIDMQGKPIKLEDARLEPTLKVPSSYGSSERLDPGQENSQAVDADFPVEALKAKRLKDVRVELTYIASPYKEETMNFPVSIGAAALSK
jgi:hypothetical protein